MAPKISPVTKAQKGGKTIYNWEGKILRTSKRDYKYVLFGLCMSKYMPEKREYVDIPDGEWRCIGFGNDAKRLVSSWKGIFRAAKYEVVTIQ